jgi:alcohol dehydrogenase class IV
MLLPKVTEYSIDSAPHRYAQCARAMMIASEGENDGQANSKLLHFLRELNEILEVPSPKAFGIDRDKYFNVAPIMAEQALASGSPGNNPIVPSIEDMVSIYHQIWD